MIYLLNSFNNLKKEFLFLFFASVLGLGLVFILPPFQAPDEPSHFFRAFQIANGDFFTYKLKSKKTGEDAGSGGYLPKSLITTYYLVTKKMGIKFRPENKIDINKIKEAFKIPLKINDVIVWNFTATERSPLLHLPQAIGIKLGILFNSSPILLFYLGRIFTFLFWLIIGFFTIRLLPFQKGTFILLLLMPTAVMQACSLSHDSVMITLSFLFAAFVFKVSFENRYKEITNKEIYYLLFLTALLSLTKYHYFLCVIIVVIPYTKFKNIKHYSFIIVSVFLIYWLVGNSWFYLKENFDNSHPKLNIINIYNESIPWKDQTFAYKAGFSKFFLNLKMHLLNSGGYFYLNPFIARLGWLDTEFPRFYIYLMLFSLCFISLINSDKRKIDMLSKLYLFTIFLLLFLGVFIKKTYFGYSIQYKKNVFVSVVQGRFFIPFSMLFFIIFQNKIWVFKKIGKYDNFFIALSLIITIFITFKTLYYRYYI